MTDASPREIAAVNELIASLRQVVEAGQPAHAARAGELVDELADALTSGESNPASTTAAHELLDAYLHDPYLTRNP